MSLSRSLGRPFGRTAVAVTAALAAALASLAVAPAVTANAAVAAPFAGYTDKSDLRTAGRAVVQNAALPVTAASTPAGTGTTYYVDAQNGDDGANGTSAATAWKTFAAVNATVFQPGDRILLKAGSTWSAQGSQVAKEAYDYTNWNGTTPIDVTEPDPTALLAPKGSGTAEHPIVLSSYGDGAAPQLDGRGVVNDVLQLTNQQHWDISNLDISNVTDGFDPTKFQPGANQGLLPGEENPKTGDLRGIHVQGASAGTLAGYDIHHVFVHDVSGVIWSIGNAGLDRGKRTGGILFEGLKGDAKTVSQFTDVVVRDNIIANTSFANVSFKQFSGMGTNRYQDLAPGWGDRAVAKASTNGTITEDPGFKPNSRIEVSGNYLSNRGTQYGWDSVFVTSTRGATIENNLIDGAGVSGIEMYYADDIVVQNNEVAQVETRVNAADSNGIDPDRGTSNILIQGNYVHDSGEGILLCGFGFSTAVVRFNVIRDVDRNYVNPHGDSGVNVIYNNLMYNSQTPISNNTIGFFNSSGGNTSYLTAKNAHYLFDNVFYNTLSSVSGATIGAGFPGVTVGSNSYFGPGVTAPSQDASALTGDPLLGGSPADAIRNATPASGASPLVASGTAVDLSTLAPGFDARGNADTSQVPLGVDFFGTALATPASVGPATYVPAAGKGLVVGTVRDQDGVAVGGAAVAVGGSHTTADASGHYAAELTAGDYALVPSATGYADGASTGVQLVAGKTIATDLALGVTTATTGDLTGTVTSSGKPLAGVAVTAAQGTQTVATATSDAAGRYTLTALPKGTGYTVSGAKEGYQSASASGVEVKAARTATVDLVLSAEAGETHYAINETFDGETSGVFTKTADGALIGESAPAVGSLSIVADPSRTGNKYLRIAKTSASSGTLAVHNTTAQNLSGIVTIEARIQRTSTNGAPNQLAMYSFNESNWNAANPGSSTNPSATFGFAGGKIMTHNVTGSGTVKNVADYTVGTWYTVRNVVNLDKGTFDFYVNDMNTPVLVDQPLRTKVTDLDFFQFFINGSNVGDMNIDYFRVNTGAPVGYDDASLAGVTASSGGAAVPVTPSQDGATYSATVDPYATSAGVTVATASPFAKLTVAGSAVATGTAVDVPLQSGDVGDAVFVTKVPVVVTAEDGTRKSYTVSIAQTNPAQLDRLRALAIDGQTLTPAFSPDRQGTDNPYAIADELAGDVASLHLTWQLGWSGQQVQVDGRDFPAGATDATVALHDGVNQIQVTSNSYPGDYGTYLIQVTRKPSVDTAALTAAVADAGGLDAAAYGADSWSALVSARDAGDGVLSDGAATQAQVDAATAAIGAAKAGLVPAVQTLSAEPAHEAFALGSDVAGSAQFHGTRADGSTVALAAADVSATGWDSSRAGSAAVTFTVRPGLTATGTGPVTAQATFVFAAAWSATTAYNNGDRVVFGGTLWTASWWTRNQTPGDPTGSWQQIRTAPDGTAIWTASRVFNTGDIVIHDGLRYKAGYWTRNETPGGTTGAWQQIATAADGTALWTASGIFTAGDVVSYQDKLYRARWWNRNQAPGGADGPWELIG